MVKRRIKLAEILIAGFLGIWLTAANILVYKQLKKDYKNNYIIDGEDKK